ncbi:GATOR2 complex protein MIOS-like isoform X2 [Artemia franciscana]|uniref:GATOR2 complex protein MIOS-like isoform X2 n=1 Tax=Artemia franciscana TaxID=6661 RepID=UPI0032DBC9C4
MARLELLWSPVHKDYFILWGTEICLYKFEEKNALKSQLSLSSTNAATLVSPPISTIPYMKCVAWCPEPENDMELAVGQTTGRVVLLDMKDELSAREFVTKHPRACNSLSWSPLERRLLLAGFEKHRSEFGAQVWDVNRSFSAPRLQKYLHTSVNPAPEPIYRIGESDSVQSLSWTKLGFSLVAGMGGKSLKLFDVRIPSKPEKSIGTRCVNGITMDPLNDNRLTSHGDCIVNVWDLRHFDKPVLSITAPKAVSKVAWSPTRPNFLGYLLRDQSSVGICDIQFCGSAGDDQEPFTLERDIAPPGEITSLVSFAWHPVLESRMITCSISGKLADFNITDRITMNWSPTSTIAWNHGRKVLKFIDESNRCYVRDEDIIVQMKSRATQGYGLKVDVNENVSFINDPDIQSVWKWMANCNNSEYKQAIKGIRFSLGIDSSENLKSESILLPWSGHTSLDRSVALRTYKSPQREESLALCGWDVDLEAQKEDPCRLACLAIFNAQIDKAARILTEAARHSPKYNGLDLIAVAISGFNGEGTKLWRDLCFLQGKHQTNPYIRSMFLFLSYEPLKFNDIVEDSELLICDRLGFALKFLPDAVLTTFIDTLSAKFIEEGNLAGLILTGFSKDGIVLIQNYIDRTGDVQNPVLLLAHNGQADILENPGTETWIQSYRCLLDEWRLWSYRAQLDVRLNQLNALEKIPQQVFLSCNFCSKSVVPSNLSKGAPKQKVSTCPSCGKPLPRCSICLFYVSVSSNPMRSSKNQMAQFDSWISWCQTCRHGGHAGHLLQWFSEEGECPVSGCDCRCMSLDTSPAMKALKITDT